jgi:hypothetical protein
MVITTTYQLFDTNLAKERRSFASMMPPRWELLLGVMKIFTANGGATNGPENPMQGGQI